MTRKIRIKDIAAIAGVSAGTVDRVIHNRGHVAAKVRQRVISVMETLGYEPNFIASALAYNRTWRIAALLPDPGSDLYWQQIRSGIQQAARALKHYGILVEYYDFNIFAPDEMLLKTDQIASGAPPDAMVVAPVFLQESVGIFAYCREKAIPYVIINTDVPNSGALCYIGQDSYQSGVLGARLLHFGLQPGQTALLLHLEVKSHNARHLVDKASGFRDYFARFPEQGIQVIERDFEEFSDHNKLQAFFRHLLTEYPSLGGIFVTNSRVYLAVECFKWPSSHRARVVGFDLIEPNLQHLQKNNIDFLINQNPVHQGYLGLMNVFQYLIRKKTVDPMQYLPLDIVVRENVSYYLKRQAELEVMV